MICIPLFSPDLMTFGNEKLETKKQRFFSSASPARWWFFLLSPKGPPSCWRAKPIIKALL
jgi:hypothetical protein